MIPTALNASALRDAYGNIIGAIGIPSSPGCKRDWSAGLMAGSRFLAGQAINIAQNAPDFVVSLTVEARIKDASPLRAEPQHALLEKFHHRDPRDGQGQRRRGRAAMSTRRRDLLSLGHQPPPARDAAHALERRGVVAWYLGARGRGGTFGAFR
jgi:hypothetical protein